MRVKLLMLCTLVVLIALPVTAGMIAVKGKVVDPSGKPVSGVKVFALKEIHDQGIISYPIKATVLSNAYGSFSFALAPPAARKFGWHDRYYFIAYAPGEWLGWRHGTGRLAPGSDWTGPEIEEYAITVSKLVTHEGDITDEQGRGIAGVALHLQHFIRPNYGLGLNLWALRPVCRIPPTITDKDGKYRVQGVPEGVDLSFRARKPGYVPLRNNKDPHHGVMIPAGSIKGRVVDERGNPLRGMRVEAFMGDSGSAYTALDGTYAIGELDLSRYWLGSRVPGRIVKGIPGIVVTTGKVTHAPDLVAYTGTLVRGRVLDLDTRKPISNAEVSATDGPWPNRTWYSVGSRTGADGTYSVKVLPGKVFLECAAYDQAYESPLPDGLPVTASASGLRGIDLMLVKRKVFGGMITYPNGKPAAGVMIKLYSGGNGMNASGSTSTGQTGRFTMTLPSDTKQQYG